MSDPYWDYKDEVNYDYEFKAVMPIKLRTIPEYNNDEEVDIPTDIKLEALESIEKGIESIIRNEDYLKECFTEPGRGRVYPGVSEVGEDEISMYFGICNQDADEEFTTEDLIGDIEEFMWVLNSNIDYDTIFNAEFERPVIFEPTARKDINVEQINKQEKKTEAIETDGELTLKDIDSNELDTMEQNLEQGINQVDRIQNLKDELVDKVNTLVNESVEIMKFPSTEFTATLINPLDLDYDEFFNNLTDDQRGYIIDKFGTIEDLFTGLCTLYNEFDNEYYPLITIEEYIDEVERSLGDE